MENNKRGLTYFKKANLGIIGKNLGLGKSANFV